MLITVDRPHSPSHASRRFLALAMLSPLVIADEDSGWPEVARELNRPLSNAGWLLCLRSEDSPRPNVVVMSPRQLQRKFSRVTRDHFNLSFELLVGCYVC